MALPMTTSGWRALRERRAGASTVSGSSAERGLRGMMRFNSLAFASMDAAPVPFACACRCERGSPAPALPEAREYDTGAGIGEGFTVATGGGLIGWAAAGAARTGSADKGAVPRSPPLGGGLDAVTADYPL